MKDDHYPGICYACKKTTQVRWKNLYTIGSEGTDLCMKCEMVIVNLLRTMAREETIKRVQVRKLMKLNEKGGDLSG